MSFSISIGGHSSNPHNEKVKEVFENAVRELRTVMNENETISGQFSSGDNTGSISGKAADVE